MNLPNILTTIRLILVPIFVVVFFSPNPNGMLYSGIIFLLAGITDILDGHIARKYNLITKYGIVLDPLADKLMLLTVLFCLSYSKVIPSWIFFIITAKELLMIFSGIWLYKKNVVIPSNIFGKASTVLFYVAIISEVLYVQFALYLLYAAVISAFIALVNYIIIYSKSHKDKIK